MSRIFDQIYRDIITKVNYKVKIPNKLFTFMKDQYLTLYTNGDQYKEFIIKNLINADLFSDWSTYNLKWLNTIRNNLTCKLVIDLSATNTDGLFSPSIEFNKLPFSSLNSNNVSIFSADTNYVKGIFNLKDHVKLKNKELKEDQYLLQIINKRLNEIDILCVISLNKLLFDPPKQHSHLFNLDEVLEHELQHFCILLIAIAKTNIYYTKHFDRILNPQNKYSLDEDEFVILFGSYNNWLIRFYKHHNYTNLNIFVHDLLGITFHNKTDSVYYNQLINNSSFEEIRDFFIDIWKSEYFQSDNLHIRPYSKNKFKTLLKWTYDNMVKNLN